MKLKQFNKVLLLISVFLFSTILTANDDYIFNLKSSTGKSMKVIIDKKGDWKFEGIKNKVVLLDFFGLWCPPCKKEIPHLNKLREELKKDFEIIGIDIGPRGGGKTDPKELDNFVKKFKMKYPVTSAGDNDKLYDGVRNLNPNGSIPFMIVFSKSGQYLKHYIGMQKDHEVFKNEMKYAIKLK
ncbi:MAG: hypothetical protein DRG78_08875 [Epsilonproteobacteria bacterium]|nr:MAG: hypothetical protein DRG78_08875 [Campylobacterota bacterium]